MNVISALCVFWASLACLGGYVAAQKGRPAVEGLILGGLFGPLGVLVAALLPSRDRGRRRAPAPRIGPGSGAGDSAAREFLGRLGPAPSNGSIDLEAIARAADRPASSRRREDEEPVIDFVRRSRN